jgi:hypothetical protein
MQAPRAGEDVMRRQMCACGHPEAAHWQYDGNQGCRHRDALLKQCDCGGYRPRSQPIGHALRQLFQCVSECERDWSLLDRIDYSLGVSDRPGKRPER